jgi:hypothetical protein
MGDVNTEVAKATCPYCGKAGDPKGCMLVRSIEYYANGAIKQITYQDWTGWLERQSLPVVETFTVPKLVRWAPGRYRGLTDQQRFTQLRRLANNERRAVAVQRSKQQQRLAAAKPAVKR